MVLFLGVLLHTFSDYGMSWDEYYRQSEGHKKLVYYQNLLAGHWAPYDSQADLYPGFYDLLHQGVNQISPLGPIATDHLLTALFAWLAAWGAYHLGRRLGNEKAGFFAALFTLLFPHFYGHAFINPKDIPFAAGFIWSLYYIVKVIDGKLGAQNFLKLGFVSG
jgi:asparagine N-glycosylation enzyme membrane subunit Stt3